MLWLLSWCFCELLTVGVGVSLTFCLLIRFFSSYRIALASLNRKACDLSRCILFWLLSFEGLLFSEEEREEEQREEVMDKVLGEVERRR